MAMERNTQIRVINETSHFLAPACALLLQAQKADVH